MGMKSERPKADSSVSKSNYPETAVDGVGERRG